jgi:hypothetical protein
MCSCCRCRLFAVIASHRDRGDESQSVIETKRISRSRCAEFRAHRAEGSMAPLATVCYSSVLKSECRPVVRKAIPRSELSLRALEENVPLEGIVSERPCGRPRPMQRTTRL